MKNQYTAVIKKEDDWWVGWIAEVPGVNCQEKTQEHGEHGEHGGNREHGVRS